MLAPDRKTFQVSRNWTRTDYAARPRAKSATLALGAQTLSITMIRRGLRTCAQLVPVPADAALRIGDQRAISAFTNWLNFAGVRSLLGGIDPPSSATFAFTAG